MRVAEHHGPRAATNASLARAREICAMSHANHRNPADSASAQKLH
jgi:hypothetical protein